MNGPTFSSHFANNNLGPQTYYKFLVLADGTFNLTSSPKHLFFDLYTSFKLQAGEVEIVVSHSAVDFGEQNNKWWDQHMVAEKHTDKRIKGTIVIELFHFRKPFTMDNILFLLEQGFHSTK
jgi:hypothetical protein